ncbi:hypothetical protein Rhal01_03573 [Rubritalea halochordaticola]|uniref:Uncharacterized protein n=1 Tax=Rubritalea halochordaticola TaxID=714537 RepID=A0ABP9V663_9BACT
MKEDDVFLKTSTQLSRMRTHRSKRGSKAIPNKFKQTNIGRIFCWLAFIVVGLFTMASVGNSWPSKSINLAIGAMLIVSFCWKDNKVFVFLLWCLFLTGIVLRYWGA